MERFERTERGLLFRFREERMLVTPYGVNGIRIRATQNNTILEQEWAMLPDMQAQGEITITQSGATVKNGKITVAVNAYGKLRFFNERGETLLREYYRTGDFGVDFHDKETFDQLIMIHHYARQYKSLGSSYRITARFEADDDERIYGMGQYQQPHLNLKGAYLELAQVNTQASVPFLVSSKGYGMLWNNPGVGAVHFGTNLTQWEMQSTQQLDYWVTADDTPAQIEQNYAELTGKAPQMPEYALGFWQCKLRYRSQEELLSVARAYHQRGLPLKVIVIDFFHWTNQGEWRFDPAYWPDPKGMVRELHEMGIQVMVSVWPTVDHFSRNYSQMRDEDLLVRVEHGLPFAMDLYGMESFTDMTNPQAQAYIWDKCKENYYDQGIKLFWLDVAEPEYTSPDFDMYRYYLGPAAECANIYPMLYAKAFYNGLTASGEERPLTLIRCAWAGMQRYGALAWSGDVPSSFTYLRNQMTAGLNMGMAGIPWWTADIGGFHGGYTEDPGFRELLVRWFEYGTFCPVMRLHGDRSPHTMPASREVGGGMCGSGADNEIWSFGEEAEAILTRYIWAREAMKPYIAQAMEQAHTLGTPVIKPLFYDFPQDQTAWTIEDAYLFGHDLLVAPVYAAGQTRRSVYLPVGERWRDVYTGVQYEGGQTVSCDAPLDKIPLFARLDAQIYQLLDVLRRTN